ncbi:hypothetical protein [Bacillus sp. EB01]|uniref:hypothetical protein n=1 Tax=Bacillus sp. EB01 TaxID=1347086 RepID=UPI0005C5A7B9|nr:hypothetical protein [Bacillus sp. EB01]
MKLLESKVIETEFEKEIYVDKASNIEIAKINFDETTSNYELMVGLQFLRIRNNDFYGTIKGYFGLKIMGDSETITLNEPYQQSIFAVKTPEEKDAVLELIDYLLTSSPYFKQLVMDEINNLKQMDFVCEKEILELRTKIKFLEKFLKISYSDLKIDLKISQ